MSSIYVCFHKIARHVATAIPLVLIVLYALPTRAQQVAAPRQSPPAVVSAAEQQQILARAREILTKAAVSEAEREVRLQVLKAVLTGTVIRPDDDYPEMRNPKHWRLVNDVFVVTPESTPVEAVADLWVAHENDGVPIARIRCFKYSSLILVEGHIQYFREKGDAAGLAALNRLLGHRLIPQGLPNSGDDLLWKRHPANGRLLPGDQVWVENPFFDRGSVLICQEAYDQARREGKSPEDAVAEARAATESLIAGEEGSNVFCLGDDRFIRGASSLTRLCRDAFQPVNRGTGVAHEQVFTPMIFTIVRFQEHMVDDNYTAQACLRADPAKVRPEDFQIKRVRSPIGPENLLRLYGDSAAGNMPQTKRERVPALPPDNMAVNAAIAQLARGNRSQLDPPADGKPLDDLIDAMASRNKPPRLATIGSATYPLFDADYDWAEQRRVRKAIDTVMRTKTDEMWWRLRAKIDDGRYVLTASRGGVARNFTLGELCSDIVDLRLCLGFTSHLPSVPGKLPAGFRPEDEYWRHEAEWAGQHKPLYAMQAALCARALELWDAIPGTLPGGDGQSHVYSADEKARCAAAWKKEIAERNRTKKAHYEEVVVPWLPAPSGWEGFDAQRAADMREEYNRKMVRSN